jgi:hypothetical protein
MRKCSGRTCDDALQCVSDLLLADLLEVAARCQDGCLVHQVLQVGTSEARGPAATGKQAAAADVSTLHEEN